VQMTPVGQSSDNHWMSTSSCNNSGVVGSSLDYYDTTISSILQNCLMSFPLVNTPSLL